ncbi:MFS transporter [Kribbella solani]|uniref:MFS transporter n=1 Tax=Kribbella solani TaxID=236067 RepID=UPI0029B2E44B|nr:MFS transporter [Kribbella solani]MDX2972873.1 MFS transporter [Kribbella solani]MDX3006979.1 MFS transporter [Kribbella solani]
MQPISRHRLFLAVAAGIAVSTVYAAQPLLVTMGTDLGLSAGTVGLFVTVTQIGYGLGLFFLVPLGDLLDRRRLIQLQFVLLAVALLVTGLAGSAAMLLVGLAAIGALAVVTQSLVAYGAALSDPAGRGRTVGTITTGIVVGILLARTASGALTDVAGWRAVYFVACALCLLIALTLVGSTPQPKAGLSYGKLLRSTIELWTTEPLFRQSALRAFFIFASFSTLWSAIALPLTERGLSHTEIGIFGLIGAAGAFAAGPAGRLADRGHGRLVTTLASVLLATSWLVIGWTPYTLVALAIGAVLLDLAVQAIHVTNQSRIYPLRPDAGSRLIGGYMVFYSLGSGLGAIVSTALYERAGWTAVSVLGGLFGVGALLTSIRAVPRTSPASRPCESCP